MRSQYIGEEGSRKRKAHKKSRQGCRNCKLRSVKVSHVPAGMPFCRVECLTDVLLKCDETKPKCKNCTSFGVVCNYDPKTPDLEMFFGGLANVTSQQKPPCTINQALLRKIEVPVSLYPVLISADDNSSFQFDKQSVDRFGRFMMRTVLSIGSPIPASLWQNETIRLACSVCDAY